MTTKTTAAAPLLLSSISIVPDVSVVVEKGRAEK